MKTVDTTAISSHLKQEVTGLCTCWEIEREDGTVYRFTDATEDLIIEGFTYRSVGAYKRTAIETTSTLSVDNLDVVGLSGDLSLPEQDLQNGLFDNARISIFLTSWSSAVSGKIRLRRGFFGEVQTLPNGTFQVELRGLMQRLSYNYMEMFSSSCLYDLGEPACGIVIRPEQVERSTSYVVGDVVLAAQSEDFSEGKRYDVTIGDASFEELAVLGIGISDYWFDVGSNPMTTSSSQSVSGLNSLSGGTGAGSTRQVIEIEGATDLPMSVIEAGDATAQLTGFWRTSGDDAAYELRFLDADFNEIAAAGFDSGDTSVGTVWEQFKSDIVAIPANAKQCEITLSTTGPDVNFDALRLYFFDTTDVMKTFLPSTLGDVYWECTNGGTTAATYPATFSDGPTAVDGSVTWTARNAFLRAGVVTSAQNRRDFIAEIAESRAVDAWFNGGSVVFVTGANAGVVMEVKAWTQSSGAVELFLSVPNRIDAGDEFLIYPGCDKSRISCAAIFNNIGNFFGFPDVPGQDDFLRYPDAKA